MTLPRLLPCALALALVLPAAAQAPLAPTSSEAHADDAPDEGINVSGAWTLTVRDPDGAIVEQRAFKNALVNPGLISRILSASKSSGFFTVYVSADPSQGGVSPCNRNGTPSACAIMPNGILTFPQDEVFENLITEVMDDNIVLSGSITVANDDVSINYVQTHLYSCEPSVAPDNCPGSPQGSDNTLTQRILDTSEGLSSLQSGQIVSVEVVIGFSTKE